MSRTFHPFGRPTADHMGSMKSFRNKWRDFTDCYPATAVGKWYPANCRWLRFGRGKWPKDTVILKNRALRHKVKRMLPRIDHDARVLPVMHEIIKGWYD